MEKSSTGGGWKGGETGAAFRRVGATASTDFNSSMDKERGQHLGIGIPSSGGCKGGYPALGLSPSGHGHVAFCRICLEAKAMPLEPQQQGPELPWGMVWRPRGGADDSDRLISPCACTGTQAYVHYTCLRAWQKSVLASSRYYEPGSCSAASVCSVCTQRYTVQPPPVAFHVRMHRFVELYARELLWFFLFLCVFYFALACNLNSIPAVASTVTTLRVFLGLENSSNLPGFRHELLGPGTVLVASPTKMSSSSIFYRSVVVVTENDSKMGGGISGVIINKPIKKVDMAKARAWELPLFLDMEGRRLPKLLGWGGPLARSSTTFMDMCPCCLQDPLLRGRVPAKRGTSATGTPLHGAQPGTGTQTGAGVGGSEEGSGVVVGSSAGGGAETQIRESQAGADADANAPQCCACACRPSRAYEHSGPGHWARYVFPGLFMGTDIQSLASLEATDPSLASRASSAACQGASSALTSALSADLEYGNRGTTQDQGAWSLARRGLPGSSVAGSAGAAGAGGVGEGMGAGEEGLDGGGGSRVVLMGHALWQPGQLEAEVRAGWWLVLADIQRQDLHSMPLKLLWRSLLAAHMGHAAGAPAGQREQDPN